jgi:hypothetical protein
MAAHDTRRKVAALMPLVERMHRGHCWVKTPNGPRHIRDEFTEFMLAEHCAGRKAYGLCPIAPGESTCRVACLDFDSHGGETPWTTMIEKARDVAFALGQDGYTPHLFRSSGGRGIHLYLLWNEPQDAYSVRTMLCTVLESMGLKSGTGGVAKGQVEVFPKQDSVALGSYGSMFILPGSGESEFLGEEKE